MKVTTKALIEVEKELGKTMTEIIQPVIDNKGLPLQSAIVLLKHCTGKTEDECIEILDTQEGIISDLIKGYNNFITRAYSIADSGNS